MRVRKAILLIAVLTLVAAACGDSGSTTTSEAPTTSPPTTSGTTAPPGTDPPDTTTTTAAVTTTTAPPVSAVNEVTIGLQLEPPTLDLTSSPAAAIPQVLLYNVYEGLVKLSATGEIVPLLAEDWTLSDDADFSLNNVLTKDPPHPFATTLAPIQSVDKVDDRTVRVTLSSFSANLLFFLTQGQGVILKESAVPDIATNPVGTGPFRFAGQVPGDSITLERYEDYWGTPALLDKVTWRYINDPNALNNALLAPDGIDIIAGVSAPELLEVFENDDRFVVYTGLTNGEVTLAINADNPPLDNVLVRQAINYATDEQAIIDGAYFGYGALIGSHTTPLDPYYVDLTGVYPHDPAQATQLLADAGVDPSTVTLRLYLPPVSYARRGGEILASQLEQVGFNVEINNVEWGVWLEDVFSNKDYDLSIVAHVEPRDLGQYGNPDYYWAYDNPDVAALLTQADAEPDEATRNDLLRQVQEQITNDAANGWLFLLPALSVTKQGITGYIANAPGLSLDITQLAFNP